MIRWPVYLAVALLGLTIPEAARSTVIDFGTYQLAPGQSEDHLTVGRAHFFDGKLLKASDFDDEQQYRRGAEPMRVSFDLPVHDLVLRLAVDQIGDQDSTVDVFVDVFLQPEDDNSHPLRLILELDPGTSVRQVVPGGAIWQVEIDARTPDETPAQFGLQGVEFTVPEPATVLLLAFGLAGLAGVTRARQRRA